MATATVTSATERKPELLGQTVVVIGGSAGIGLEVARRARAEGADVILTAVIPSAYNTSRANYGAEQRSLDATDPASLERFFQELPKGPTASGKHPTSHRAPRALGQRQCSRRLP